MQLIVMPQLSSFRKVDKKCLLTSDSNFVFNTNFIKSFRKKYTISKVFMLVPPKENTVNSGYVRRCLRMQKIVPVTYHYIKEAIYGRYNFDVKEFEAIARKIFSTHETNILLMNDPCLVTNAKSVLLALGLLENTKVITYNHWCDSVLDPKVDSRISYFYRQVEGAIQSKFCGFNSNFAIKCFKEGALAGGFNEVLVKSLNCIKIPPAIDFDEIEACKSKTKFKKFSVIFSHRLSSLPAYKANLDNCLSVFDAVKESGRDFEVVITNPSGRELSEDILKRDYINTKFASKLASRESFLNAVSKCHMGIGLFEYAGMWSISLAECIAMKLFTIIPRHSGYVEIVPAWYTGFVSQRDLVQQAIVKMCDFYDDKIVKIAFHLSRAKRFAKSNYSVDAAVKNVRL